MRKLTQSGFAQILLLIPLLIGLVVGVILVQKSQILKSKASNPAIVFKTADNQPLEEKNNIPQSTLSTVRIEFTSTLGPPSQATQPSPTSNIKRKCDACSADLNKDGYVNLHDFSIIKNCFRKIINANDPDKCTSADTNGDGQINLTDINCIKLQFGKKCDLGSLAPSPAVASQSANNPTTPTGTVSYRFAETPSELDTASWKNYTQEPAVEIYTFGNVTPSKHFIWVDFKDNSDKTERRSSSIELINSQITGQAGQQVSILVLKYFPLNPADSTKIDTTITKLPPESSYVNLNFSRQKADETINQAALKLTDLTRYHGYKNPSAPPALQFQVLDKKEFLKPVPRRQWPDGYFADYQTMLTQDVDICDYVDNQGVKDVWIWGYQTNEGMNGVGILESNMSMGQASRSYWEFGDFGDVSNDHYRRNDLPQCNKTYVVYTLNYRDGAGVGIDNILHDYGHQIESEMRFADGQNYQTRSLYENGDNIFLRKFTTRDNATYANNNITKGCGDLHSPPNAPIGSSYDYTNESLVSSDCEDWKPDRSGQVKQVTCHTWSGTTCGQNSYYTWWFQNIPGLNNNISFQGNMLRNWWEFMGDFDLALSKGKSLLQSSSNPSPSLTPIPSVIPTPAIISPTSAPTTNVVYSTPTNLSGQCSGGKLHLTWSPVNGVDNYKVYIHKYNNGITMDDPIITGVIIQATSYTKIVAQGKTYNWGVWSVDSNGNPHEDAAYGSRIDCN